MKLPLSTVDCMAIDRFQLKVQLGNLSMPVLIIREKRLNARASIGASGIKISVPITESEKNCKNNIENLLEWAIHVVRHNPERFRIRPTHSYHHGQLLVIGENLFLLRIGKTNRATNLVQQCGTDEYGNSVIQIVLSDRQSEIEGNRVLSKLVSRGCAMAKEPSLRHRIQTLNLQFFGHQLGTVRYRFSRSRWGSCRKNGNINISTRLMAAPPSIFDYVLIHELAHLEEFNHSQRFWRIVSIADPNYQQHQAWLVNHQFDPVF